MASELYSIGVDLGKGEDISKISLLRKKGNTVYTETIVDVDFALKVIGQAEAYLLSKDLLRNKKFIQPSMLCAMLTVREDPCICTQILCCLMYAVSLGTMTVVHENQFSLA